MKYLCKSKGTTKNSFEFAGFDDWDSVVRELDHQWDDFVSCQEFQYADVGKGGVFFDVTQKVCEAWLTKFGGKAEIVEGTLNCPPIVKDECPEFVAELEGESLDWEAEVRAMNRDYYNSLGVSIGR